MSVSRCFSNPSSTIVLISCGTIRYEPAAPVLVEHQVHPVALGLDDRQGVVEVVPLQERLLLLGRRGATVFSRSASSALSAWSLMN